MSSETEPIDVLEEILKRNSEPGEEIDLRENEVDHYFYFDKIANPGDLEAAWAVFPESQEIRKRLQEVDSVCDVIDGWGYRVPKESNRCEPDELLQILRTHIERMRSLIPDDDYYRDVINFIDGSFDVQIAPADASPPEEDDENALFDTLYEVISEFTLEHCSLDEPHKELLYNWAIYLTKCDEVAAYLLWPCLDGVSDLPADTPDPGFQLWANDCRMRYWIKDEDFGSGVVYIAPP